MIHSLRVFADSRGIGFQPVNKHSGQAEADPTKNNSRGVFAARAGKNRPIGRLISRRFSSTISLARGAISFAGRTSNVLIRDKHLF
jgi:hypothetical protein